MQTNVILCLVVGFTCVSGTPIKHGSNTTEQNKPETNLQKQLTYVPTEEKVQNQPSAITSVPNKINNKNSYAAINSDLHKITADEITHESDDVVAATEIPFAEPNVALNKITVQYPSDDINSDLNNVIAEEIIRDFNHIGPAMDIPFEEPNVALVEEIIYDDPMAVIQDEIMIPQASAIASAFALRNRNKLKARRRIANRRFNRRNPYRKFYFHPYYYGYYRPSALRF